MTAVGNRFHVEKGMKKHVQEEDTKTTPEPTAHNIGQKYGNRRNGTSRSL